MIPLSRSGVESYDPSGEGFNPDLHEAVSSRPDDQAKLAAAGLAAMIEGLWLRCALSDGPLTIDQARHIARDYARRLLHKD